MGAGIATKSEYNLIPVIHGNSIPVVFAIVEFIMQPSFADGRINMN